MKRFNYFILMVSLFLSLFAQAEEHGGGGEGGHGGGDAKDVKSEKPQLPAWADLGNKIAGISAKIKAKQAVIDKLISDKKALPPNSPQVKDLADQLVKEHKELVKLNEDFEKQKSILRYRYPERGLMIERQYKRENIQTIEQLENQQGVDGKLNRSLLRMRSQYGIDPQVAAKLKRGEEKKAKPEKKAPEAPVKSIDAEEVPVLSK